MSSLYHTIVSPVEGQRNYAAVIFVGAIVFVLLAATVFMATRKARKTFKVVKIKDRYKATVRSFDSFFSDLLPFTFRYETVSTVFRRKLLEEHDLTRFGNYPGSPGQTRSERIQAWFLLLLKLLTIFACNMAMAVLYYPANHTCDHRTTVESCTNSIKVEIIGSLCSWNAQSNTCQTASASEKFGFTLTLLFATLCVTTLLDKLFKFTISHAVVAIKSRRLSWLYGCCLPAVSGEVFLPELRGVRNVRVAPAPAWERGRFTLGMPDTALTTKPTGSRNTSTSSNPGKIYLAPGEGQDQDCSGQDATLSMALEAAEGGLEHFGDEWKALAVQSRKSTILRAARFTIMKQHMDYVSAAVELQHMLNHSRERHLWMETPDKPFRSVNWLDALRVRFRLRQLSWFHFGDPTTSLELMDLAHLYHPELIEQKLRSSRRRATDLRAQMMRREDGQEREAFLLRAFIAHSLSGYKRVVACSVLFDAENAAYARPERVIWQYCALFLTPLFVLLLIGVSFYGALAVPRASTQEFIVASALSIALNVLWQQPAVIWLLHAWVPSTAKKDVMALHWVLQVRARSILTRRRGLLHSVNALVQHFHPACRAARLQPHLPVSRLLLSLSDYDLPVSAVLRRPRRRSIVFPRAQVLDTGSPLVYDRCEAILTNAYALYRWTYTTTTLCVMSVLRLALHGLYVLPVWLRESVVELFSSGSLLGLLALLYYTNKTSASGLGTGVVLGVTVLIVTVSCFKIRLAIRREEAVLARLEMQSRKYNMPISTFGQPAV